MIARIWRGQAAHDNAAHYRQHAVERVFPSLAALPGHRGAYLLTREIGDDVEFLTITLWDDMEAVKQFAGGNPEPAVVEPEASAVLSQFDEFVRHYEVSRLSCPVQ